MMTHRLGAVFTVEQAQAAYDVLVGIAGAAEGERNDFVASLLERPSWNIEYRFRGHLGFGGKFRSDDGRPAPYVDCYPEDRNAERLDVIKRTNVALESLFGKD